MTSTALQEMQRCGYRTATLRVRTDTLQPSAEGTAGSHALCTYCLQSPELAVKTCGTCEASLCKKHLDVHSPSGEHDLFEPTASFAGRKCPNHMLLLTHYCTKDASILCHSCFVNGEHKGHLVESLHIASEKKKEKLETALKKRCSRRERTQKRIESLHEKMLNVDRKGNDITDDISSLFTDLRGQLVTLERQMVQEVFDRQQKVKDSIREKIQELEIKMRNLSEQISYTEELCKMTDPLTVMQSKKFANSNSCLAQEAIRKMSDEPHTRELDRMFISMTLFKNLTNIVNKVRQRKGFCLPEVSDMALDEKTAGDFIFIMGDGKTACKSKWSLAHAETPEKFYCPQALSRKSFSSGQHVWEVEAGGHGDWNIGVAYPSIERKGTLSFIGINTKSWCLKKSSDKYSVKHNVAEISVDAESNCHRFLIYLNYDAGQLSFYQLSNPINHLHSFMTNFTEPLHAAFTIEDDAWVRIWS
ncbi:E3 ubiquitin/ISG15 ligase TRIM25-like [Mantella aurantiaca]